MTRQISDTTARDSRHDVFQCSVKDNDQTLDQMRRYRKLNDEALNAQEQISALVAIDMVVLLVSRPSSY